MTIAVDFDGVIHAYSRGWQGGAIYDEPLPGAPDGLRALMERDAVFILTARPDRDAVASWLTERGFVASIDERCRVCGGRGRLPAVGGSLLFEEGAVRCHNCEGGCVVRHWNTRGVLLVTDRKLPATVYLDDRAVRFVDWDQALVSVQAATEPR